MNIENLIRRRKSELDLSDSDIASRMTAVLGDKVSPESVGHYFTGTAGIPIEKVVPFIEALGLKVVRSDEMLISPDKLAALQTLTKEALHIQGWDSRRSKR